MGGWGSGRRWCGKSTTSEYLRLDIRIGQSGVLERNWWLSYHHGIEVSVQPCSNCGHPKFRRVKRKGLLDSMMALIKLYPWECENCEHKTYSRQRDAHGKP